MHGDLGSSWPQGPWTIWSMTAWKSRVLAGSGISAEMILSTSSGLRGTSFRQTRRCRCGSPFLFCHSMIQLNQISSPNISFFTISSRAMSTFCLKTLAQISGLSNGLSPGCSDSVISLHLVLHVKVMKRVGLPILLVRARASWICSLYNLGEPVMVGGRMIVFPAPGRGNLNHLKWM